ncbi:MAG: sugar ABC transporter permease [Clostridiales bacterium]|nr:sugar ABC transporter permease [Clostridiales bacterium]
MRDKWAGYKFISPWLIGVLLFTAFPMIFAAYISLTDWPILGSSRFIGLANFKEIFTDKEFYQSLMVTARYAVLAVPIGIISSFIMALLMNFKIKGVSIYRTIYYLPAVVSGVAVAVIWRWILNPNYGVVNMMLGWIGVQGPNWLGDPNWVLPSYLLIAIWGSGSAILTYIVGLKDISNELYEAATIDGAGFFKKLTKITIPLMTPILYYNLIMGIVAAFRKFTDAYIIGGAGNEGRFYMVNLYENAFSYYRMGYATALAWVLFIIILSLTLLINKSSKKWMYGG